MPIDLTQLKIREKRERKLRAQLGEAEIAMITGVVGPPGPGGSLISRESDEWELLFSLAYWRPPGGEVRESKLTLRKLMSRAALNAACKRVRPYDLLQAKVRLIEHSVVGTPQGLLVEIAPDRPHDTELESLAHKLREPVVMRDDRFGEFVLNPLLIDWFEAQIEWGSTPVKLSLKGSGADEVAKALATAHALWDAQEAWHQRIVAHAIECLLPLKNCDWLKDDEEPLAAADFAGRMSLTSITVYQDGTFKFWFNDSDLFLGHSITVGGDLRNGPKQSIIEG